MHATEAALSGAGWALFTGFAVALVAGIVLGVRALTHLGDRHAHQILDQRLARGEIPPEEHRNRIGELGPRRKNSATVATALIAIGLIGAIVVAMAGPGGGFMDSMMGGMGSMMGGGEPGRSGASPVEGASTIRVTAREYSFSPAEIRLRRGETVNIELDNEGGMFHTFTASDLGFELRANAGDSIAGKFVAERAGTYSFICSVSGHAQAGMRGRILITA